MSIRTGFLALLAGGLLTGCLSSSSDSNDDNPSQPVPTPPEAQALKIGDSGYPGRRAECLDSADARADGVLP